MTLRSLLAGCFALALTTVPHLDAADADETATITVVTAPDGSFRLEWTGPHGPLRLALGRAPAAGSVIPLPPERQRFGAGLGNWQTDLLPLSFISPDGRWIFISTRSRQNVEIRAGVSLDYFESPALLLRRTDAPDGTIGAEPFMPDRFDEAVWNALAKDSKLAPRAAAPKEEPTHRTYAAHFVDWSADSARLLLRIESGLYSVRKEEWIESAVRGHYCYFNTRTGKFELTDRLRQANAAMDAKAAAKDYEAADAVVVLNAESAGAEGPELPADQRFEAADKRLNDVYAKLMAQLSPPEKKTLLDDERAWLIERDTSARVRALQTWSGGTARFVEGQAMATEARVHALEARLKP